MQDTHSLMSMCEALVSAEADLRQCIAEREAIAREIEATELAIAEAEQMLADWEEWQQEVAAGRMAEVK